MALVPSFLALVQPLDWTMRAPCFRSFVTILAGWLFAPRRTITGALVAAGVAGKKHHAAFHRVFATARWSLDEMGLIVFQLITPLLPGGTVKLTFDDTLAHKRGKKVFGVGMHHDPMLSTRKLKVTSWGHSWVVLAVVVALPFCPGRVFSLPILFRLYFNRNAAARARRTYKKRSELAVELLERLCKAHRDRHFHAVADSAYGGETVLGHLPDNCDLTSCMPLSTRLHDLPPARVSGANGRPRKHGARQPSPGRCSRNEVAASRWPSTAATTACASSRRSRAVTAFLDDNSRSWSSSRWSAAGPCGRSIRRSQGRRPRRCSPSTPAAGPSRRPSRAARPASASRNRRAGAATLCCGLRRSPCSSTA